MIRAAVTCDTSHCLAIYVERDDMPESVQFEHDIEHMGGGLDRLPRTCMATPAQPAPTGAARWASAPAVWAALSTSRRARPASYCRHVQP